MNPKDNRGSGANLAVWLDGPTMNKLWLLLDAHNAVCDSSPTSITDYLASQVRTMIDFSAQWVGQNPLPVIQGKANDFELAILDDPQPREPVTPFDQSVLSDWFARFREITGPTDLHNKAMEIAMSIVAMELEQDDWVPSEDYGIDRYDCGNPECTQPNHNGTSSALGDLVNGYVDEIAAFFQENGER